MKTILLVVLMVVASVSFAQMPLPAQNTTVIKNGSTYTSTTAETSAVYQVGGASRVSLYGFFRDTVNVTFFVDTRPKGSQAATDITMWTHIDSTGTITINNNAGGGYEWVLRDNTVERCPGLNNEVRFRIKHASTQGTTTNTKDIILQYTK